MDSEALIASKTGDVEKLKERLDRGINIDAQDDNGRTLLHHAANNGKREVVQCLLKNGADVLTTSNKNNTALHIAIAKSDKAVMKVLLVNVKRDKLRKLLDTRTKTTASAALHVAAKNDSYDDAAILLEYGANFEITNYAGEKPIDVAMRGGRLRRTLDLIDKSFLKAKKGDGELADDLFQCDPQDFSSVMNCRDKEGHTIIQVLVLQGHYKLANNLLWARVFRKTDRENEPLHDTERKNEVDRLAKIAREFRDSWPIQRANMEKFLKRLGSVDYTRRACKLGCQTLEKAHGVLLAYRKFEGRDKSLTIDPPMKTLEEVIEALGFDTEELFVGDDEEACYYEKLPEELQEDVHSFIILLEGLIDATIDFFLGYVYSIQSFTVVKDNDVDKVEELISMLVINNGIDSNRMTPICYAAENGNEQIVRMLLNTTGRTVCPNALSPVYIAAKKGHSKIVDILLDKTELHELPEFIDFRMDSLEWTALHVAAKEGYLDVVKILLRYGATYGLVDQEKHTALDLSTNQEVSDYLKFIDRCFEDAKQGDVELAAKIEAMEEIDFMAVTNARNLKKETIAEVAAKAKAEKIVQVITKKMEIYLGDEQFRVYFKLDDL